MHLAFNLLDDPWIPCLHCDGHYRELGLRKTLTQAHEIMALGGETPVVIASLYRLLLAAASRSQDTHTENGWARLWQVGQFDPTVVDDYAEAWRAHFELFAAEHPFYQDAAVETEPGLKSRPVSALIHEVASGNNATLFDHHTDDRGIALTPAQAARTLITAQAFGLAGLSGLATPFTDGPAARGINFLLQGCNLFETLLLNLPCVEAGPASGADSHDSPAWELDDPFAPERMTPRGCLDHLTWQSRRIRLIPEEQNGEVLVRRAVIAPGLRLAPGTRDPLKLYRRDAQDKLRLVSFAEDRPVWRDIGGLLCPTGGGWLRPSCLERLERCARRGLPGCERQLRLLAIGMASDQAKVEFYRTVRLPVAVNYFLDQPLADALIRALSLAEECARLLWGVLRLVARTARMGSGARERDLDDRGEAAWADRIVRAWAPDHRYWTQLELPFLATLETLPDHSSAALTAWQETIYRTVWSIFQAFTQGYVRHGQGAKQAGIAHRELTQGLARLRQSGSLA